MGSYLQRTTSAQVLFDLLIGADTLSDVHNKKLVTVDLTYSNDKSTCSKPKNNCSAGLSVYIHKGDCLIMHLSCVL